MLIKLTKARAVDRRHLSGRETQRPNLGIKGEGKEGVGGGGGGRGEG